MFRSSERNPFITAAINLRQKTGWIWNVVGRKVRAEITVQVDATDQYGCVEIKKHGEINQELLSELQSKGVTYKPQGLVECIYHEDAQNATFYISFEDLLTIAEIAKGNFISPEITAEIAQAAADYLTLKTAGNWKIVEEGPTLFCLKNLGQILTSVDEAEAIEAYKQYVYLNAGKISQLKVQTSTTHMKEGEVWIRAICKNPLDILNLAQRSECRIAFSGMHT